MSCSHLSSVAALALRLAAAAATAALASCAFVPPQAGAAGAPAESLSVEERALRAVLAREELREYEAIPAGDPARRAAWIDRYWRRTDPDPTTPQNERLAAHVARLARARALFATGRGLAWDDRCAALVRFGEPLARVEDPGEVRNRFGLDPPRERWLYADRFLYMEDRDLDGRFDHGISPLVSNIGRVDNLGEDDAFFKDGAVGETQRVNRLTDFEEHPEVEQYYTDFSEAKLVKLLEKGREDWQKTPTTYQHGKTGEEIPFFFDLSTFRGDEGKTDLVVNYLIPMEALARDERGAWVERRTVVLDGDLKLAASDIEAIEQPVVAGGARGKWVLNVATVRVPAGRYEVASRVTDLVAPGRPMGLLRTNASVPDYGGASLLMSDIAFGSAIVADSAGAAAAGAGAMARSGWRLTPRPVRRFDGRSSPYLYFEIYNLAADVEGRRRYSVEYALSRREKKGFFAFLGGGAKGRLSPGVAATFERETRAADEVQWITVDTRDLPPDTYFIEARVKDLVSGAEASRKESFVVVGETG